MDIHIIVILVLGAVFSFLIWMIKRLIGKCKFLQESLDYQIDIVKSRGEIMGKLEKSITILCRDKDLIKSIADEKSDKCKETNQENESKIKTLTADVKYWKTQCNRARGKLGLVKLEGRGDS